MERILRLAWETEDLPVFECCFASSGCDSEAVHEFDLAIVFDANLPSLKLLPEIRVGRLLITDHRHVCSPERLLQALSAVSRNFEKMPEIAPDLAVAFQDEPPLGGPAVAASGFAALVQRRAKAICGGGLDGCSIGLAWRFVKKGDQQMGNSAG